MAKIGHFTNRAKDRANIGAMRGAFLTMASLNIVNLVVVEDWVIARFLKRNGREDPIV